MSESDDRINVRANVLGFEGNELKVSLEPRRITILGKKEMSGTEKEGRKEGKSSTSTGFPARSCSSSTLQRK
jgi:HSP20 family molecular chaperone IbpA